MATTVAPVKPVVAAKPLTHQVITNTLIAECIGCHWHLSEVREFGKPVAIVCVNEDCNYFMFKLAYPTKLTLDVISQPKDEE